MIYKMIIEELIFKIMVRFFLFSLFLITNYFSFSQPSDLISVHRKNGSIIKTFFAGSAIDFQLKNGAYMSGPIKEIKNDSVFIYSYQLGYLITNLGTTVTDTVERRVIGVNYKDILRIKVFKRTRFIRGNIGKLLMIGGAGYFGLNVINSLYLKEPVGDKSNITRLGIAAGAFGTGFLINKLFYVNRYSRKWHKIVYINLH